VDVTVSSSFVRYLTVSHTHTRISGLLTARFMLHIRARDHTINQASSENHSSDMLYSDPIFNPLPFSCRSSQDDGFPDDNSDESRNKPDVGSRRRPYRMMDDDLVFKVNDPEHGWNLDSKGATNDTFSTLVHSEGVSSEAMSALEKKGLERVPAHPTSVSDCSDNRTTETATVVSPDSYVGS
jgi:hypothetical protein